jgi:hypothetical protein
MKINWGTAIVIVFIFFISFILFFVYKVESDNSKNELVVEEYYKHDAHFQDELTKIQNAQDLKDKPTFTKNNEGLLIAFPAIYDPKKIIGEVSLYRPSNKKFDFEIPISLSNSTLLIPKKSLLGGLWDITVTWNYEGKDYLTKETFYY